MPFGTRGTALSRRIDGRRVTGGQGGLLPTDRWRFTGAWRLCGEPWFAATMLQALAPPASLARSA